MNPKQKFGVAVIAILLIISILFTALNLFYYNIQNYHIGKTRAILFDETVISHVRQKDRDADPPHFYKNIMVTHGVHTMVFIIIVIVNYIIIAISLIWLYRVLKRRKT
ncbi:MAG: hypothetical protein PVI38_07365 [Desulfobacterales bacterium]|jgi:hypothetical protein